MPRKVPVTPPAKPPTETDVLFQVDYDTIPYSVVRKIRSIARNAQNGGRQYIDEIEDVILPYIKNISTDSDDVPYAVVQKAVAEVLRRINYANLLGN